MIHVNVRQKEDFEGTRQSFVASKVFLNVIASVLEWITTPWEKAGWSAPVVWWDVFPLKDRISPQLTTSEQQHQKKPTPEVHEN